MSEKFIDRFHELATLEDQFNSSKASFVVVYGRRRVGKTFLITHFMKKHKSLYFLATEESEEQNINAFKTEVAQFIGDDLLSSVRLDRWEPIFERLASSIKEERVVLVIDEFQYLGKANPAFPSVFQRIWDMTLSKANVMLIVCGSLISMMTSQVLSYGSPLYGRRTTQIRLQQVPFSFYGEFFSEKLDERTLIERYSITGGVPKYIEAFKGRGSTFSLIEKNVLNQNSFLFDEPNFLLSKEVGEVGSYFSIIKAIAFGNHKLGDIASALNVKSTSLTKYLKTLELLDLVSREVPVTEANPAKSKRGLYFLKDNYIRFWFRFIFPAMGLLETGRSDAVMARIKANLIDSLTAYVYEEVCRDRAWALGADGELPFLPERVGRYWEGGETEIDVVALSDSERAIAFGECKFWKTHVGVNVLQELEAKARRVKWHADNRRETFMLFSISGYTDELKALAQYRDNVLLL